MGDVRGQSRTGKTSITDLNEPAKFIKVGSDGSVAVTTVAGSGPVEVTSGQLLDSGNSATRTATHGTTQFVGTFYQTRSVGIVRQLTVLVALDSSGNVGNSTLGGTFVFEYSENGTTATISESRMIDDFSTVRDFDLLNAGEYYRVKFTPSRALTGSEAVIITTTQRRQNDGAFVRLANQEIEEANSAMPQTFAYIKGFQSSGKSANVRVTESGLLRVAPLGDFEMFGAQVIAEPQDYVSSVFTSTNEMNSTTYDASASSGSTSVASGNLVVASGTSATGDGKRVSKAAIIYTPGYEGRARFTAVFDTATAGAKQQVGIISKDGQNGIYLEKDGTGLSLVHLRAGVEVSKVYSTAWNGDVGTLFTKDGEVVPFVDTTGRAYQLSFGYLGYLGFALYIWSPDQAKVLAHRIFYDNEVVPLFTDIALSVFARSVKTSGATNVVLKSGSWQGATMGRKKSPLVSAANSTSTALGAAGVFTGDWISHEGYNSLELIINTDQLSAGNGIEIQSSDRGDAGAIVRSRRLATFNAADVTNGSKHIIAETRLSFTRLVLTNGGTPQGSLFLQLRLHEQLLETPRSSLEADVASSNVATMSRSLIFAKNATTYGNIERGVLGGLDVGIVEHEVETPIKSLSSFQVTRVSVTTTPTTVFTPNANCRSWTAKAITSAGKIIYVAENDAKATVASGFPLQNAEWCGGDLSSGPLHASCDSGTQALAIFEVIV